MHAHLHAHIHKVIKGFFFVVVCLDLFVFLFSDKTTSLCLSVTKHFPRVTTGGKGLFDYTSRSRSIAEGSQGRSSGRNHRDRHLAPVTTSATFLTQRRLICLWMVPTVGCRFQSHLKQLASSISYQENVPQTCPKAKLMRKILSVPLPRFHQLTRKITLSQLRAK